MDVYFSEEKPRKCSRKFRSSDCARIILPKNITPTVVSQIYTEKPPEMYHYFPGGTISLSISIYACLQESKESTKKRKYILICRLGGVPVTISRSNHQQRCLQHLGKWLIAWVPTKDPSSMKLQEISPVATKSKFSSPHGFCSWVYPSDVTWAFKCSSIFGRH